MRKNSYILLIVLAACGGKSSQPDEIKPVTPEARNAILSECQDKLTRISEVEPHDRPLYAAESCAALYQHPDCQSAWKEGAVAPVATREKIVVTRCTEAYCPLFEKGERPAICSEDPSKIDLLDEGTDWMTLWADFSAATFERDLLIPSSTLLGQKFGTGLLRLIVVLTPSELENAIRPRPEDAQ